MAISAPSHCAGSAPSTRRPEADHTRGVGSHRAAARGGRPSSLRMAVCDGLRRVEGAPLARSAGDRPHGVARLQQHLQGPSSWCSPTSPSRSALAPRSASCCSSTMPAGMDPRTLPCPTASGSCSSRPTSPELQPAEHPWAFVDEPLVNRYFQTIEHLEGRRRALRRPHAAARLDPRQHALPLVAAARAGGRRSGDVLPSRSIPSTASTPPPAKTSRKCHPCLRNEVSPMSQNAQPRDWPIIGRSVATIDRRTTHRSRWPAGTTKRLAKTRANGECASSRAEGREILARDDDGSWSSCLPLSLAVIAEPAAPSLAAMLHGQLYGSRRPPDNWHPRSLRCSWLFSTLRLRQVMAIQG